MRPYLEVYDAAQQVDCASDGSCDGELDAPKQQHCKELQRVRASPLACPELQYIIQDAIALHQRGGFKAIPSTPVDNSRESSGAPAARS